MLKQSFFLFANSTSPLFIIKEIIKGQVWLDWNDCWNVWTLCECTWSSFSIGRLVCDCRSAWKIKTASSTQHYTNASHASQSSYNLPKPWEVNKLDHTLDSPWEVPAAEQRWERQKELIPATWVLLSWRSSFHRVPSQPDTLQAAKRAEDKWHAASSEEVACLADSEQHLFK